MCYEDFVSFDIAKLLKEKGFNDLCPCGYNRDGIFYTYESLLGVGFQNSDHTLDVDGCCTAPTVWHTLKWLRDKGFFVRVILYTFGYSWMIEKCSTSKDMGTLVAEHDSESGDDKNNGLYTTFELAFMNGIKYCLNNLLD